jgi:hypothetical protein
MEEQKPPETDAGSDSSGPSADAPRAPAGAPLQETPLPKDVQPREGAALGSLVSNPSANPGLHDLTANMAINSDFVPKPSAGASADAPAKVTPPATNVTAVPKGGRRVPPTPDEILQRYGVRSARDFVDRHKSETDANDLIAGIIPRASIGLLLGDSELGKSPLAYLMAICVASGVECLGSKVRQGPVVYFDFENGSQNIAAWLENIPTGLGLPKVPDEFRIWSTHDSSSYELNEDNVSYIIGTYNPSLVIIDTLPSFLPKIEDDNKTVNDLYKQWRGVTRKTGSSILFIHHPKKEGNEDRRPPLLTANLREWFQWTRGPKSIVTGVDVRLGVDAPSFASLLKVGADGQERVDLILRGMSKGTGEVPTRYLTRTYNDEGVPLIYRALTGVELLFDPLHITVFKELGQTFATKDAKHALGKGDSATAKFLGNCQSCRLIVQTGRGQWKKTQGTGESGG